jgi:hypothetical protein
MIPTRLPMAEGPTESLEQTPAVRIADRESARAIETGAAQFAGTSSAVAAARGGRLTPGGALALQRAAGNAAVARILDGRARRPSSDIHVLARDPPGATTKPEDPLAGTLIDSIVINPNRMKVLFVTSQGAPIHGDVDFLDRLPDGAYKVKRGRCAVGPKGNTVVVAFGGTPCFVFEGGTVSGLRFEVTLDGADPWTLRYPASVPVLVDSSGLEADGINSLEVTAGVVIGMIKDDRWQDVFEFLVTLNDVDLADLLASIEKQTGFVGTLLLKSGDYVKKGIVDYRLLTAMESLVWKPEDLYVDHFDSFILDPESWVQDEERAKQHKWNIKIDFVYSGLKPERAIQIYADDIADTEDKSGAKTHYGQWSLLYPEKLTKGTVPKMWAAKKKIINDIEAQNVEFFMTSYMAVESVLGLVQMGSGLLTSTVPAATTGVSGTATALPGRRALPGTRMSPEEIRFSQTTVGSDAPELASNMKAHGWVGEPIDVVRMPDGKLTSVDNTRVLAARQAGIEVRAVVHEAYEPLPGPAMVERFTTKGGAPKTWGDAITLRVAKQSKAFSKANPMGSFSPPRVSAPKAPPTK